MLVFCISCNNASEIDTNQKDTAMTNEHTNHHSGASNTNLMSREMDKMMETMMAAPLTNDADHDFAQLMKGHHQAAVDMARLELEQGRDSAMRRFAQGVVDGQSKEIARFESFLSSSKPKGDDEATSQKMMATMHEHMEPYKPLRNQIDYDFVALMIPHHQSAVAMSEAYQRKGRDKELLGLAASIISSQKVEIQLLQDWINAK
jgi:uncharacterized protein (DUF305 family)